MEDTPKAVAIIPARFASTRLPGKPLLAETGKCLIQHVVEAVAGARRIGRIVVATDDERIAAAVRAFGGEAVMTREDHRSGSDRLSEAAEKLGLADEQVIVNVQGDEPEIPPACVDRLVEVLAESGAEMATLLTAVDADEANDPNRVKCVTDKAGRALYFSRSRVPFDRDGSGTVAYKLHLGIYAYTAGFLRRYTRLPATPAEQAEKLEQLRVLESGWSIVTAEVEYDGAGIDTPADYEAFVRRVRSRAGQ